MPARLSLLLFLVALFLGPRSGPHAQSTRPVELRAFVIVEHGGSVTVLEGTLMLASGLETNTGTVVLLTPTMRNWHIEDPLDVLKGIKPPRIPPSGWPWKDPHGPPFGATRMNRPGAGTTGGGGLRPSGAVGIGMRAAGFVSGVEDDLAPRQPSVFAVRGFVSGLETDTRTPTTPYATDHRSGHEPLRRAPVPLR